MVQDNKAGITEKINLYRKEVESLCRYLNWLDSKRGQDTSASYDPGEGKHTTLVIPTYDSTLLGFVKLVQNSKFLNRNYHYVYSKYRMKTAEDELRLIQETQIMEIENIGAILSKYVLKGMTRAKVWTEGVQNGVYYAALFRMKELMEFWTTPY